jgi:hypothetical protein
MVQLSTLSRGRYVSHTPEIGSERVAMTSVARTGLGEECPAPPAAKGQIFSHPFRTDSTPPSVVSPMCAPVSARAYVSVCVSERAGGSLRELSAFVHRQAGVWCLGSEGMC